MHLYADWIELVSLVEKVDLTGRGDTHVWLFETSQVYSVKSFYKMISFGGISHELKDYIWKI